MPKLLNLVLRDIARVLAGSVLAWLAFSLGLDYIWLGRPLGLSLLHWTPSFAGSFMGIALVYVLRTVLLHRSEETWLSTPSKKPHFERLAPQKVLSIELGYIVQSADRSHIEYVESTRSALVEVEHGPVVAIYRDSLTHWKSEDGAIEMSLDERETVLSRINLGLHAMGCECEFY